MSPWTLRQDLRLYGSGALGMALLLHSPVGRVLHLVGFELNLLLSREVNRLQMWWIVG
jgi:hypothetical protein